MSLFIIPINKFPTVPVGPVGPYLPSRITWPATPISFPDRITQPSSINPPARITQPATPTSHQSMYGIPM